MRIILRLLVGIWLFVAFECMSPATANNTHLNMFNFEKFGQWIYSRPDGEWVASIQSMPDIPATAAQLYLRSNSGNVVGQLYFSYLMLIAREAGSPVVAQLEKAIQKSSAKLDLQMNDWLMHLLLNKDRNVAMYAAEILADLENQRFRFGLSKSDLSGKWASLANCFSDSSKFPLTKCNASAKKNLKMK